MALARRFALPPVQEAMYEPRQIPNAARDLEGTVLLRPPREVWLTLLGEVSAATQNAFHTPERTRRVEACGAAAGYCWQGCAFPALRDSPLPTRPARLFSRRWCRW